MDFRTFIHMVNRAIDALPQDVIEALDNVGFCVEEGAEDGPLGEYIGVPRIDRSIDDILLPDKIVVYYRSHVAECENDPVKIAEEIRRTLWHEIAHHLGWDDDALHAAEERRGWRHG